MVTSRGFDSAGSRQIGHFGYLGHFAECDVFGTFVCTKDHCCPAGFLSGNRSFSFDSSFLCVERKNARSAGPNTFVVAHGVICPFASLFCIGCGNG